MLLQELRISAKENSFAFRRWFPVYLRISLPTDKPEEFFYRISYFSPRCGKGECGWRCRVYIPT